MAQCARVRSAGVGRFTCAVVWGGVVSMCAAQASGVDLPIVNPGFETLNVTLSPGEQTGGAGGGVAPVNTRWVYPFTPFAGTPQSGVIVPGWRTIVPGVGSGVLAGVLNPSVTLSGRAWMTGFSGNYVAAAQAAQMQQTLNVLVAPSTRYTLSFLAGIGITDSSYAPLIGLYGAPDLQTLAFPGTPGVTTIARAPFMNIDQPQFGTMIPMEFSYITPEVLPADLQGKYIAISFLGSDGIPRMCFDDFRLTAEVVPSAGGASLAVLVVATGMRRRRRGDGAARAA